MARNIQLRVLNDEHFLRELHHFLWMEPQFVEGRVDAGWNCRDHALVVALTLACLGHRSSLASGEALFARGTKGPPAAPGFAQKPHNWVVVDGIGAIDLSIKSQFECGGVSYRVPLASVFADAWHPRGRGRAVFLTSPEVFARTEAELKARPGDATAVYLTQALEPLHAGHLANGAAWTTSIMAKHLTDTFGDPAGCYAALALHLRDFLLGSARPLSRVAAAEAWATIAQARGGAVDRVLADARACLPPAPETAHAA